MTRTKLSKLLLLFILPLFLCCMAVQISAAENQTSKRQAANEIAENNHLPVLYINTNNGRHVVSKTKYTAASMTIGDSEEVLTLSIRGRGNSTWGMSKKPYKIRLDEKADLFGMGKSRHWILLANAFDASHLRNKLSYDLSARMGMTAIESTFVNLFINGDYMGLYQLTESVRSENGRVPVYDWEDVAEDVAEAIADEEDLSLEEETSLGSRMKKDLSWVTSDVFEEYTISDYINIARYSIYGGYILELDEYYDEVSKFTTPEDVPIMIKSPEYLNTNDEMFACIRDYIFDMEEAMFAQDGYNADGKHYSEYVDMESFVDYWIVNQVFKSVELLYKSCFMYKDSGEKLVFGPVWDMDWSSGNHENLSGDSADPYTWTHDQSQDREYWYRALYDQPSFVVMLQDRWWEIRPLIDEMIASIDPLADELSAAAEDNIEKWRVGDFEWEVEELKNWLVRRAEWMDEQLSKRDPDITGRGIEETRSYTITVTDENGTVLEADTVSEECRRADLYVYGNGDLSVEVDTVTGYAEYVDVYVNGIKLLSADTHNSIAEFDLEMSSLYTDGRRNVIHAIARNSAVPTSSVGERYITLLVEPEETEEEEEIPVYNMTSSETEESSSKKSVSAWFILPAAGVTAVIICIAGIILKTKKRKIP